MNGYSLKCISYPGIAGTVTTNPSSFPNFQMFGFKDLSMDSETYFSVRLHKIEGVVHASPIGAPRAGFFILSMLP
jgi:hypothetical protein